jgi:hypothetical protein
MYRMKGKEGDIYSWIWFAPRAALFTTGDYRSEGSHELPKSSPPKFHGLTVKSQRHSIIV